VAGLTLWHPARDSYSDRKSGSAASLPLVNAKEDVMTVKMPAAKTLTMLLSAVAVIGLSLAASQADAQTTTKRKPKIAPRAVTYTTDGPNVSYQSGPRTRVYITKRSWLDAGVEVLPGDRKFSDYAFPQGQTFAVENLNRSTARQPLNPPSDFGYGDSYQPRGFPLY
jgi:hypothetical protein